MDPSQKRERHELALVLLLVFAFFALPGAWRSDLSAPPQPGDGPDYDSLAFQLAQGRGFRVDWDDPAFRRPYLEANQDGRYDYVLARSGGYTTTYRPPLLPAAMALCFELFGRRFEPIRLLGCAAMAAACAVGFALVRRRGGRAAAWASTALVAALDPRAGSVALQILTESWACLAGALVLAASLGCVERPSLRRAALAGAALGAAVYARTAFAMWIPLLLVFGLVGLRSEPAAARAKLAAAFLAAGLLLPLPWMIRNCLVLGEFAPLGTQGAINLAGGYGDAALSRGGVWSSPGDAGVWEPLLRQGLTGLELERAKAQRSRELVRSWIAEHPQALPVLAAAKTFDLWRPRNAGQAATLLAALLGLCLCRRPQDRAVLLALAAAGTIPVALTWSAGDRYLLPLLPVLQCAAGLGFGAALERLASTRRAVQPHPDESLGRKPV
jgi:4-amino-4-deoxy-L-arabinose transferase-like glycosyltransferase